MRALFLATSFPLCSLCCCLPRPGSPASASYSCIICPVSLCRWPGGWPFSCSHLWVCGFMWVSAFMCGLLLHTRFLLKVSMILRTVCSGRALRLWLVRCVCVCVCVCEDSCGGLNVSAWRTLTRRKTSCDKICLLSIHSVFSSVVPEETLSIFTARQELRFFCFLFSPLHIRKHTFSADPLCSSDDANNKWGYKSKEHIRLLLAGWREFHFRIG